jgi:DNA-binding NarL/FixJ family response regulator
VSDEPQEPIRVVLVDDHPSLRDGVRADLEASGVATVVGEAADGGEAIEVVREAMPDVVLMDLSLPRVHGRDAIKVIVEESPHVKILVFSASEAEANVLEAIKLGAAGYLLKTSTADELVSGVTRVHAGDAVFTPSLAGLLLSEFRRTAEDEPGEPGLTQRENEILRLVAKGYSYGDIAKELFISTKTVQNHVRNILTKLHLRSRYELMRYAIRKGLDATR